MNIKFWQISAILGLSLVVGCSSQPDTDSMFAQANDVNIKRLATLYSNYQIRHDWKGPKNEIEFRSFISEQSSKRLERIGVDPSAIDQLFISERDGKPLKIRWELQGNARGPSKPVVFEQDGVNGKYLVAFTGNLMREVDQSDYDKLWEGRGDDGSMSASSPAPATDRQSFDQ